MKIISLICCLFPIVIAMADDLGTVGKTYPIAEPDMIEVIKNKAKTMVANGQWDKIKQQSIDSAKSKVYNPQPVIGITHTKKEQIIYYDPMFRVDEDIKDGQGHVIAKAGYYNPLTFKPFPEELIFIDGADQVQVEWAVARFKSNTKKTKIILTSGSYINLDKKYRIWFYYDQNGKYTEKLGIKHVPATVNQEGKKIRINELVLNGAT
ncbi:MAG: type-F conjugative transfer system protein TraW [Burkholderiales bacterium]|nr:type-F conjugative transfer system protein TraW [Burkholderiales bacterium]